MNIDLSQFSNDYLNNMLHRLMTENNSALERYHAKEKELELEKVNLDFNEKLIETIRKTIEEKTVLLSGNVALSGNLFANLTVKRPFDKTWTRSEKMLHIIKHPDEYGFIDGSLTMAKALCKAEEIDQPTDAELNSIKKVVGPYLSDLRIKHGKIVKRKIYNLQTSQTMEVFFLTEWFDNKSRLKPEYEIIIKDLARVY